MSRKNDVEKSWTKAKWYYWVNLWEVEKHITEDSLIKFRSDTNSFFLQRTPGSCPFGSSEAQLILKPLFYNSPHVMDAINVFPLSKVIFEGKEYNAPAKVEEYLKNIFGDIYSFPPYFVSHGDNYSEAEVNCAIAQLQELKDHFAKQ